MKTNEPSAQDRCGARKRAGGICRARALPNGRCRLHGGLSTGPRTPGGLIRSRRANWKHGAYAGSAYLLSYQMRDLLCRAQETIDGLTELTRRSCKGAE